MIKILSEGSSKFGFGHLVRCMSIVNYCRNNNYSVTLFVDGDETSKDFVDSNKASMINWKNNDFINESINEDDIVFVDSYYTDIFFINSLKNKAKKCLIIDDYNRLNYEDCIIINPNFCAEMLEFNQKNDYLVGEKYILLRDEFVDKQKSEIKNKVENILITLGGSDVLNLTPRLIEYVNTNFPHSNIHIVVGFGYQNIEQIKSYESNNNIIYYSVDARKMAELIITSDFVISAAGQTLNEILKLRTPACFVKVIENQQINIDFIQRSGMACVFNETDFSVIKEMNSREKRVELFDKMADIDNRNGGAKNIFDYLRKELIINE